MAALVVAAIFAISRRAIPDQQALTRFRTRALLLLAGWLTYVTAISFTGILTVMTLPPRIPLLLVLPCFVFIGWFFRSGRFTAFIAATPASWLVYAQSFRVVVELLLWRSAVEGLLPVRATFEGYNYEIVIGGTALLAGYLGYTRRVLPVFILRLWNYAGLVTLAIVVFLVISRAYAPGIYDDPGPFSAIDFGSFPVTLLAGFLMPLAVFLHVFSLVLLRHSQRSAR